MTGGRVVVAGADTIRDGRQLAAEIERCRATIMQATPATWRLLIAADWQPGRPLRILCGGETMSPELAEQLLARSSDVWNVYGPTETTIWSSAFRLKAIGETVPIGCPIDNTTMHVLDARLQPVPIGVVGELYIGGLGVSPGYLDRPELTADRFLRDPFSEERGAILYKTGDLGRRQADGALVCLGRRDHQLKIRGHRIELGEIEATLLRSPFVADAVVLPRGDASQDRTLVAYVVPTQGTAPRALELRMLLIGELPLYMVPAAFVLIDAMPMTPSGKIDRLRLLSLSPAESVRNADHVGPRDELESRLVEIWEAFFATRPIGIRDDFFHLGGHSLSAVQLLAKLEANFASARLSLASLLRSPTIEQLAALIRNLDEPEHASTLVPLQVEGDASPYFFVPGAYVQDSVLFGHSFSFTKLARRLGSSYPFYTFCLDLSGEADQRMLAPEVIAARFLDDVLRVQARGPYHLGGYSFGGLVALELARQLLARGESIGSLIVLDTAGPGYPRDRTFWERTGARLKLLFLRPRTYAVNVPGKLAATVQRAVMRALARIVPAIKPAPPEGVAANESDLLQRSIALAGRAFLSRVSQYSGRLTLLRATEHTDPVSRCYKDTRNGWGAIALGGVEVVSIEGSHLAMFEEPALSTVAAAIRDRILPDPGTPYV